MSTLNTERMQFPVFPAIHIVDSVAGGKGKSTLSKFFANHIRSFELTGKVFDADLKSLDGSLVGGIASTYPETVNLDIRGDLDYGATMANDLIFKALRCGFSAFINLPGSSFEYSSAWLQDSNLLRAYLKLSDDPKYLYDVIEREVTSDMSTMLGELMPGLAGGASEGSSSNKTSRPPRLSSGGDSQPLLEQLKEGKKPSVYRWFMSGPTELDGQEFRQSVEYYDNLCPGRITHILVRNTALVSNPLRPNWQPLYDVEGIEDLLVRGDVLNLEFPRLAQPEVDALERLKLVYSEAALHPELSTTSHSRVFRFLKAATSNIMENGLLRELKRVSELGDVAASFSPSRLEGSGSQYDRPELRSSSDSGEPANDGISPESESLNTDAESAFNSPGLSAVEADPDDPPPYAASGSGPVSGSSPEVDVEPDADTPSDAEPSTDVEVVDSGQVEEVADAEPSVSADASPADDDSQKTESVAETDGSDAPDDGEPTEPTAVDEGDSDEDQEVDLAGEDDPADHGSDDSPNGSAAADDDDDEHAEIDTLSIKSVAESDDENEGVETDDSDDNPSPKPSKRSHTSGLGFAKPTSKR